LGLDVGSVNVKLSLVDERQQVILRDAERIISTTGAAVDSLLARLDRRFTLEEVGNAGVTGGGRAAVSSSRGWPEFSGSLATAAGLLHDHPDARTIVQIGGQTSTVMSLADGLKKPWKMVSNPLCAAGTGRFLEQQAYRLDISLEDFANLALECQESPPG